MKTQMKKSNMQNLGIYKVVDYSNCKRIYETDVEDLKKITRGNCMKEMI